MFGFQKLDGYRCAVTFLGVASTLAERVPRGHSALSDQLRATNCPRPMPRDRSPANRIERFTVSADMTAPLRKLAEGVPSAQWKGLQSPGPPGFARAQAAGACRSRSSGTRRLAGRPGTTARRPRGLNAPFGLVSRRILRLADVLGLPADAGWLIPDGWFVQNVRPRPRPCLRPPPPFIALPREQGLPWKTTSGQAPRGVATLATG